MAWSDANTRKVGKDGKVPSVGNTVNMKKATYTNDIGDSQLAAIGPQAPRRPLAPPVAWLKMARTDPGANGYDLRLTS